MAGTIKISQEYSWNVSSGLFYWVILALADTTNDLPLRQNLQSIESNNLGWFDLSELNSVQRDEVEQSIKKLPELGRQKLHYKAGAPTPYIDRLHELVAMLPTRG